MPLVKVPVRLGLAKPRRLAYIPVMRLIWIAVATTLGIAACAEPAPEAEAEPPVPTEIELAFSGYVAPVLDSGDAGEVVFQRKGAEDPVVVPFQNRAPTAFALVPGEYELTRIGVLQCRGLEFDVDPSSEARALGTIRGDIVKTSYYVALMAGRPATTTQVSALAGSQGLSPDGVDATPILLTEKAPCFIHRGGPGETWRDRPLGEQILLGIGFAGFCAVAVAAGGFCAF